MEKETNKMNQDLLFFDFLNTNSHKNFFSMNRIKFAISLLKKIKIKEYWDFEFICLQDQKPFSSINISKVDLPETLHKLKRLLNYQKSFNHEELDFDIHKRKYEMLHQLNSFQKNIIINAVELHLNDVELKKIKDHLQYLRSKGKNILILSENRLRWEGLSSLKEILLVNNQLEIKNVQSNEKSKETLEELFSTTTQLTSEALKLK